MGEGQPPQGQFVSGERPAGASWRLFNQYFSSIVLLTLFAVFLVFAATMMLFFRQENAERRSHLHHRHHWHRLTLDGTVGGVAGFLGGLRRRAANARLSGGTDSGQDDFVRPSGEAERHASVRGAELQAQRADEVV